ncbi:MAG: lipopolysaccharide transport periplasmic protein LptA [Desulfovibrionaceae bacterium]|nr:lipopolysaccharide transport periplasmic protein LptA [Desulfovibrionaceae bacterium]
MKHVFVSALLTGLVLSGLTTPAAQAAPKAGKDLPIHIISDSMTYDTNANTVVFQGNVEVEREDFRLWSAVLTLYLKKADTPKGGTQKNQAEPSPDTGDLDHIVAEKNVRFTYNTQTGTAQKATYTVDTGLLVLEGDPVVRDGESSISGERIRYYMNENRSEVDGGPQKRVQAVFSSSGGSSPRRR